MTEMQEAIYAVEGTLRTQQIRLCTLNPARTGTTSCTAEVRVADYLMALRSEKLWPPSRLCMSQIEERTKRLSQDQSHNCSGGRECILRKELRGLSAKIDAVVRGIKGLSIESNSKRE